MMYAEIVLVDGVDVDLAAFLTVLAGEHEKIASVDDDRIGSRELQRRS